MTPKIAWDHVNFVERQAMKFCRFKTERNNQANKKKKNKKKRHKKLGKSVRDNTGTAVASEESSSEEDSPKKLIKSSRATRGNLRTSTYNNLN